jgi:hypothetical protein
MDRNRTHKVARTTRQLLYNKVYPTRDLDCFKLVSWFAAIVLLWGIIIAVICYLV